MKILIAEDEAVSRTMFKRLAEKWGYQVEEAREGLEAWDKLKSPGSPSLVVLDWMMPGLNGLELCKKVRSNDGEFAQPKYLIMLTARTEKSDVVTALDAGANDFITKPFHTDELRARLAVGRRILELEAALAARVDEVEKALAEVKTLRGILPICMYCHKIRTDEVSWQRLEQYISSHTQAEFSHGLCPECEKKNFPGSASPAGKG
jgi:DNA-binding response OmpR family regulator